PLRRAAHAPICRHHRSTANPKLTDAALVRETPSPKRHARARASVLTTIGCFEF
ncbi:Uncharacterized protein FWK35_00001446, partial [Aphis craccivora]